MREPGLARERTALAWVRSALSFLAGAGLAIRYGIAEGGGILAYVLAALLASAAGLVTAFGRRPTDQRQLAWIAAVTGGAGALAFAVVALA